MSVKQIDVHPAANIIKLDGVSFCIDFATARISGEHPHGPVFEHGAAKAVLTSEQADQLVAAGVQDKR
ncbi:hypothetical protein [Laribacter hongkongensis]|uniref:hypothetical protein n=1 Tax=Laribacter hongkongensis TaxID=168471 RepID=UPI001EFDB462|nr:hypothetical protein [Laribacter hongkongensis]MCG9083932.1 hypothetical protein [Laribacter hongkongensis]